jgi:hypothetical protein
MTAKLIRIIPRETLKALLGKPAGCCWETTTTGFDVTEWSYDRLLKTEVPERTQFVDTHEEAVALRRRWKGQP